MPPKPCLEDGTINEDAAVTCTACGGGSWPDEATTNAETPGAKHGSAVLLGVDATGERHEPHVTPALVIQRDDEGRILHIDADIARLTDAEGEALGDAIAEGPGATLLTDGPSETITGDSTDAVTLLETDAEGRPTALIGVLGADLHAGDDDTAAALAAAGVQPGDTLVIDPADIVPEDKPSTEPAPPDSTPDATPAVVVSSTSRTRQRSNVTTAKKAT